MRIFRGQAGAASGARFSLKGFKGETKLLEEASIGSSIASSDQFDIIVPYKTQPGTWKVAGEQRDDDTDVSSITTDEHRLKRRNSQLNNYTSSANSSFCCCSAMTSEPATPTDNTLITSRIPPPSDVAAIRDIYEASDDKNKAVNSSGFEFLTCCGPTEQPMACPYDNASTQRAETLKVNRSNSLFDAITDEDDVEHHKGPGKRLGKTLRRAILWKRKQHTE